MEKDTHKSNNENCVLSVVVPCYNEARTIPLTYSRISAAVQECGVAWEILFVDDGSRDASKEILTDLHEDDDRVKVIVLSRNFGHQAALTAGMAFARGRAVITMDSDLQHPPEVIPAFFEKWLLGAKVVHGIRGTAKGRNIGKAWTSRLLYRIINYLSDVKLELNAADFRLLDRSVVDYLNAMPERMRFLRGQVAWLGFPSATVQYDEDNRMFGKSKYSVQKMFSLARDAVTSLSVKPLLLSVWLGIILIAATIAYGVFVFVENIMGHTSPGWTSVMLAVLGIGGIELLVLTVHGVYMGQLWKEVLARPQFCVLETYGVRRGHLHVDDQ